MFLYNILVRDTYILFSSVDCTESDGVGAQVEYCQSAFNAFMNDYLRLKCK